MTQQLVSFTPAALERMRGLIAGHSGDAVGIRLGVKSTGCSGLSYKLDFAESVAAGDEVVDADGIKVVVDPKAAAYVLGTEIDFVEDKLGAMFVFKNPNEKARCGCGESFTV